MNLPRNLPILEDPLQDMAWLGDWLNHRVIPISDRPWTEITAEFADAHSYMSVAIGMAANEHGYLVTIELGVRFEDQHRANACLVAGWDREEAQLQGLRSVLLDGQPSELRLFVRRMVDYIELPRMQLEVGENDLTEVAE